MINRFYRTLSGRLLCLLPPLAGALLLASQAHAACSITRFAALPVTMDDAGPMIDAKIDGKPARFIADSGAFFSVISPGSAQALHLAMSDKYQPFEIIGVNGSATAQVAMVKTLTLAGQNISNVPFVVAGSEVGGVGVIGQNVLGLGDVEYDLPHGMVRLMRSKDCSSSNLAYWAGERTFSIIRIHPRSPQAPHTIGTVYINGKPIEATFDTGAETTMLSQLAAARLGIKPGGPGVVDGGTIVGFGRKYVRTWIAKTDLFSIGDGEQIRNAKIRFGPMATDTDMLIGADFFIAHRVYVDNKTHRMFLTYEGGPVFNTKARYEGPGPPSAAAPAIAGTGEPATAELLSREGAVALSRKDYALAVSDFTKAIALSPAEPRYLSQRSDAYFAQGKNDLARADLAAAIKLAPDDVDRLLSHAGLMIEDRDRKAALVDLDAADHAADPSAMGRLTLGALLTLAGQPQRAVGQFDLWMKAHPDDVRRPQALNGRCWARAMAGTALDQALADCNAALRIQRNRPAVLDSRGVVQFRRGDLVKARADFDAALAVDGDLAWSHYVRGIIRQRAGDATGAQADIKAAIAADAHIVEDAKAFGIAP